jgi:hypothetical protein
VVRHGVVVVVVVVVVGGKRTESILFVFPTRTATETPVILAHPTENAITETLVKVYRDRVGAADEEVDEQPAVHVVRRRLEEAHEDAREGQTAVFGRYGQRCNVAVEVVGGAFRFAQDCFFLEIKKM